MAMGTNEHPALHPFLPTNKEPISMNEELQTALTTLINKLMEAGGSATDFVVSEAPTVVQQLLLFAFVKSFLFFLLGVTFILTGFIGGHYHRRWIYSNDTNKQAYSGCDWVVRAAGFIIGFIICTANLTWLKVWLAPTVFVLEYAARYIP
jgi:hypothetical protein